MKRVEGLEMTTETNQQSTETEDWKYKLGEAVDPHRIYFFDEIQEMFGISNVTALDWMEHYGFPSGSVTGRARGRRIFTGRKILDWVESLR
tara:strand:- start:3265 stop:3537 length:273 start_codon:yes stop_codon:yes gene_type:complete